MTRPVICPVTAGTNTQRDRSGPSVFALEDPPLRNDGTVRITRCFG